MAGKWTVQLVIMTGALLMVLVFSGAFLDPPRLGARTGGAVHVVSRVSSPYRVGGNTHNRRPPERAHVGLRCGELAWLGPVSDALGCQEQVLAQPAAQCSHRHFVLADLGDNNCACAPPGSDCKRGSPEVRIAKVSSLYRVGGNTHNRGGGRRQQEAVGAPGREEAAAAAAAAEQAAMAACSDNRSSSSSRTEVKLLDGAYFCQCPRGMTAHGPGSLHDHDFGPWPVQKGWSLHLADCQACGCGNQARATSAPQPASPDVPENPSPAEMGWAYTEGRCANRRCWEARPRRLPTQADQHWLHVPVASGRATIPIAERRCFDNGARCCVFKNLCYNRTSNSWLAGVGGPNPTPGKIRITEREEATLFPTSRSTAAVFANESVVLFSRTGHPPRVSGPSCCSPCNVFLNPFWNSCFQTLFPMPGSFWNGLDIRA